MFFNLVNNRYLPDLSVGYSVHPITHAKTFREVTVCEDGFFDGAEISLCASKHGGPIPLGKLTKGWYISRVQLDFLTRQNTLWQRQIPLLRRRWIRSTRTDRKF
jgi:hypothetical protein